MHIMQYICRFYTFGDRDKKYKMYITFIKTKICLEKYILLIFYIVNSVNYKKNTSIESKWC